MYRVINQESNDPQQTGTGKTLAFLLPCFIHIDLLSMKED